MAFSPSDISYAVVVETVPGTTPSAPAFKTLDTVGGTAPYFTADSIQSNTRKANRGGSGSRLTNFRVEGGLKAELVRDPALELLLASALSGTWQSDVLKAGQTDSYLTIEKKMPGSETTHYQRYLGCTVSDMTMNFSFGAMAEVDFTILGLNRDPDTSALVDATYEAASNKVKLADLDISNITIAGLPNAKFSTASLTVSNGRQPQNAMGTPYAIGIGSDRRTIEFSVTMYRRDFSPEALIGADGTNPPVAISMTVGSVGEGYTIHLPKAQPSIPTESEDGTSLMVTITFTAMVDDVAGTDLMITRI